MELYRTFKSNVFYANFLQITLQRTNNRSDAGPITQMIFVRAVAVFVPVPGLGALGLDVSVPAQANARRSVLHATEVDGRHIRTHHAQLATGRVTMATQGCRWNYNDIHVLVWQQLSDRNCTFLRISQSVLSIKF